MRCFVLLVLFATACSGVVAALPRGAVGVRDLRPPENKVPRHEVKASRRKHVASKNLQKKKEEEWDMIRKEHIQDILRKILEVTGLESVPNVTGFAVPDHEEMKYMIEQANNQSALQMHTEDDLDAEVTRKATILPMSPEWPYPKKWLLPDINVIYFNLSEKALLSKMRRAILHVWMKPYLTPLDKKVPITVYRVVKPTTDDDYISLKEVTTVRKDVYPDRGYWLKIELYSTVYEWVTGRNENYGIIIESRTANATSVILTDPEEDPTKAPNLQIILRDSPSARSKRTTSKRECYGADQHSNCCKYQLFVDFEAYDWDFIVAPKRYIAFFCNGECSPHHVYSHVYKSIIRNVDNKTSATVGRCCGAKKYVPMTMLYYTHQHQIKYDVINDIIVDQCGCS